MIFDAESLCALFHSDMDSDTESETQSDTVTASSSSSSDFETDDNGPVQYKKSVKLLDAYGEQVQCVWVEPVEKSLNGQVRQFTRLLVGYPKDKTDKTTTTMTCPALSVENRNKWTKSTGTYAYQGLFEWYQKTNFQPSFGMWQQFLETCEISPCDDWPRIHKCLQNDVSKKTGREVDFICRYTLIGNPSRVTLPKHPFWMREIVKNTLIKWKLAKQLYKGFVLGIKIETETPSNNRVWNTYADVKTAALETGISERNIREAINERTVKYSSVAKYCFQKKYHATLADIPFQFAPQDEMGIVVHKLRDAVYSLLEPSQRVSFVLAQLGESATVSSEPKLKRQKTKASVSRNAATDDQTDKPEESETAKRQRMLDGLPESLRQDAADLPMVMLEEARRPSLVRKPTKATNAHRVLKEYENAAAHYRQPYSNLLQWEVVLLWHLGIFFLLFLITVPFRFNWFFEVVYVLALSIGLFRTPPGAWSDLLWLVLVCFMYMYTQQHWSEQERLFLLVAKLLATVQMMLFPWFYRLTYALVFIVLGTFAWFQVPYFAFLMYVAYFVSYNVKRLHVETSFLATILSPFRDLICILINLVMVVINFISQCV